MSMSLIWSIIAGVIAIGIGVSLIANGEAGCFTILFLVVVGTTTILSIMTVAEELSKPKATTETTTEVISTTMERRYTAVVKNADGSEVKYDIKDYETKDGTMTLTLKDGTKVFVPITNIAISEQPSETTTETTNN